MPSSSEGTIALARIARRQSRWRESLRSYEEAATLSPRDAGLHMDWAWTLSMLRRHRETLDLINRALAIKPDDADILVNKAMALQVMGDVAGARHVLENIKAQATDDLVTARVRQLLYERNYAEAARLLEDSLAAASSQVTTGSEWQRQWLGYLRRNLGDVAAARDVFDQAAKNLERLRTEQPENHFASCYLAMAEAGRGNKEAALRAGEQAVAMRSAKDDPVYGPIAEEFLAMAETQAAEHERALPRIERLLATPYGPFPLTQASLRLDPIWDPLRQHPRFKALVEGPEPKTLYH
jgi:serine/threonine-protein kinase